MDVDPTYARLPTVQFFELSMVDKSIPLASNNGGVKISNLTLFILVFHTTVELCERPNQHHSEGMIVIEVIIKIMFHCLPPIFKLVILRLILIAVAS
jgi:hypothetical protein